MPVIIPITVLQQMVELLAALLTRFLETPVHQSLGLTAAAHQVIQTQPESRNCGNHLLRIFGPRSGHFVTGSLRAGQRCAEQLLQQ